MKMEKKEQMKMGVLSNFRKHLIVNYKNKQTF